MRRYTGVVVLLMAASVSLHGQVSPTVSVTAVAASPLPPIRITNPRNGTQDYMVGEFITLQAVAPLGTPALVFYNGSTALGEHVGGDCVYLAVSQRCYALLVKIGVPGVKSFSVRIKGTSPQLAWCIADDQRLAQNCALSPLVVPCWATGC